MDDETIVKRYFTNTTFGLNNKFLIINDAFYILQDCI